VADYDVRAIDGVVNIFNAAALAHRPVWRDQFLAEQMRVDENTTKGVEVDEMLRRMDSAGIERGFLIAAKCGPLGHPACFHMPMEVVNDAIKQHPDRFFGLYGVDPTQGMKAVYELQHAVEDLGYIGAHGYPHWFELPLDHARWYPIYTKCCELDVPIQHQIGQSMVYSADYPIRSVGQPITMDAVACDFPELKLVGIHVGIPWTEEAIAMSWKHKNVYLGSDAHSPKYWPASFVNFINTYGQDKVIFGTDFPVLGFERTRDEIENLGLRPIPKRKLLRDNIIRLYKLDQRGVSLSSDR
jgi:predicted TIM-barrel fold metal-dependent hydrolase